MPEHFWRECCWRGPIRNDRNEHPARLTGATVGPGFFDTVELIGREQSLHRFSKATECIGNNLSPDEKSAAKNPRSPCTLILQFDGRPIVVCATVQPSESDLSPKRESAPGTVHPIAATELSRYFLIKLYFNSIIYLIITLSWD